MRRIIISSILFLLTLGFFLLSNTLGQFLLYFESRDDLLVELDEIESLKIEVSMLSETLLEMKGEESPKTLRQIMGYIMLFDGVIINYIKAFELNEHSVHFIKDITQLNDPVVCDGYEISLEVPQLLEFLSHFDESQMSYHSADLLFGSNTVIVRVRTGGGL